jgi:metallo-beta-lactamase class B
MVNLFMVNLGSHAMSITLSCLVFFRLYLRRSIAAACIMALCNTAAAEVKLITPPAGDPQRTELAEPFEIIDGVYFVGARIHLPSYLFTSAEGHILMDTAYDENVSEIVDNIKKLGFDPGDIKFLLSTHAHHDHVGGHSNMREITGATTLASAADADVIESGGETDFRDRGTWAPGKVDRIIEDGEQVRIGDRVLTAHFTPGHTKGCTTWTTVVEEDGKQYDLAVLGGLNVNKNEPLIGHPKYPDMPQQFAWSFARLKVLPVDVYLGGHGYWYGLDEKRKEMLNGAEENPFIDPDGYQSALRFFEKAYLRRLKTESNRDAH